MGGREGKKVPTDLLPGHAGGLTGMLLLPSACLCQGGAPENAIDWRRVLVEEAATETDYGLPPGQRPWQVDRYVEQMLGPGGVNRSLVDETMFGAGSVLSNVSKESLRAYVDQGVLVDAVTRVPGSSEGRDEEEEEEEEEDESRQ